MVTDIFALIMKEARTRPGDDLVLKIYSVLMDVHLKILPAMEEIRNNERRQKKDEGCRKIHNGSTGRTDMEGSP